MKQEKLVQIKENADDLKKKKIEKSLHELGVEFDDEMNKAPMLELLKQEVDSRINMPLYELGENKLRKLGVPNEAYGFEYKDVNGHKRVKYSMPDGTTGISDLVD